MKSLLDPLFVEKKADGGCIIIINQSQSSEGVEGKSLKVLGRYQRTAERSAGYIFA